MNPFIQSKILFPKDNENTDYKYARCISFLNWIKSV
jgi:hypothetical protein